MSVAARVRAYLSDAARAFSRAPLEVALAVFSAAAFSFAVENQSSWDVALHFAVATGIAGCAAWSATLLHGMGGIGARTRWLISGAGAAFAIAYLLLTRDLDLAGEVWRAFMLAGAALLLTFSAPALPALAADPNVRLRRINARVVLRAAGIILYGLALFGGLALALAAIDNLFELKLHGEIYAHVFIWIMLVLVPWVIVGGIDEYVQPLDEQSDVARVVHRLTTYLVPLLVAIYFLILYVYVVRIVMTRELPQNLVSPMVIAAGLLSQLSLILFAPAAAPGTPLRWLRFTPLAYLPLVPLGFWALFTRFQDYGWTEFRVLRMIALVAVFVLAVLMALRVVRRRELPLRVIPVVLAIALLIPAIGPWSALAISRRDQQGRLATALAEARIDPSVAPLPGDTTTRQVPQQLYERITSGSAYLSTHFGRDAVFAEVPAARGTTMEFLDLATYFRLTPLYSDTLAHSYFTRFGGATRARLASGYAWRVMMPDNDPANPRAELRRDTLYIRVAADSVKVDLAPALAQARSAPQRAPRPQPVPPPPAMDALAVWSSSGERRGDLLILDMSVSEQKGVRRMGHLDAVLVLR